MTKIKDLVEKYGDREIDEDELEKLLKPAKVKTIYDLEVGDKCYYITERGTCDWVVWDNDNFDYTILAIGNVFLTQEECEFRIEYLKVKAELKRYASMCEEQIDWNNNSQVKYTLAYDNRLHCFDINTKYSYNTLGVFFTDEDILKQAIEEIGKKRIKKYYFGVKVENK